MYFYPWLCCWCGNLQNNHKGLNPQNGNSPLLFQLKKFHRTAIIIFTQSAECICRLEGPSEFVEKTRVTVKNGTLVISYKDKNARNVKDLTFYITAPDLSKVKIDGVGNFDAKEELKLKNIAFELDGVGNCNVKSLYCDELKLDVDGVGNMKLNVDCSTIKAKVDGVGNITVSGKADAAFFKRDGVGKINSKNLKCKDVTKKGWNF